MFGDGAYVRADNRRLLCLQERRNCQCKRSLSDFESRLGPTWSHHLFSFALIRPQMRR